MPQCYQSIVIAAPVEQVWDTIRNFHDFSWAAGVIDSCEAVGEIGGCEIGAKRVLNGAFHETLLECNEALHRIRYSIDDGPSPDRIVFVGICIMALVVVGLMLAGAI